MNFLHSTNILSSSLCVFTLPDPSPCNSPVKIVVRLEKIGSKGFSTDFNSLICIIFDIKNLIKSAFC